MSTNPAVHVAPDVRKQAGIRRIKLSVNCTPPFPINFICRILFFKSFSFTFGCISPLLGRSSRLLRCKLTSHLSADFVTTSYFFLSFFIYFKCQSDVEQKKQTCSSNISQNSQSLILPCLARFVRQVALKPVKMRRGCDKPLTLISLSSPTLSSVTSFHLPRDSEGYRRRHLLV